MAEHNILAAQTAKMRGGWATLAKPLLPLLPTFSGFLSCHINSGLESAILEITELNMSGYVKKFKAHILKFKKFYLYGNNKK